MSFKHCWYITFLWCITVFKCIINWLLLVELFCKWNVWRDVTFRWCLTSKWGFMLVWKLTKTFLPRKFLQITLQHFSDSQNIFLPEGVFSFNDNEQQDLFWMGGRLKQNLAFTSHLQISSAELKKKIRIVFFNMTTFSWNYKIVQYI